jgi:ABC-type transport system involved in multi-copper enzyme maturation permease subunit
MAVAYSFGGVTEDYLWSGTLLLVLTCLEVGALSIACSAYFPTTVEAFVGNYVIFLVLYAVLPFAWGPRLFDQADRVPFVVTAVWCFPILMLTGGFLLTAWMCVESRAFVPPSNVLLGLFKRLDAWFNDMNRVTGGIVLVRDGEPLPGDRPIAWRETAKKSLGTFRYLFRVLVVIELPLLFICAALRLAVPGGASLQPISACLFIVWVLAAAMIIVHAGSVISSERTRQTLDVLLATPMSGRELVLEKLQGVRRLIGVLLVPFLTIFAFETWWNQSATYRWIYFPLACAALAVYLPLIVWIALCVGLKVRSQIKAVLAVAAIIGGWLLVPTVAGHVWTDVLGYALVDPLSQLLLLNPAALIPALERTGAVVMPPPGSRQVASFSPSWLTFGANLLLHGWVLYALRRWCLANADRLLGRLGERPLLPQERPNCEVVARYAKYV